MNDYRIFFGVWNETSSEYQLIELPVNPSEVTITYPANPTNYDVEGVGDIIVPRIPKLATVTFDSFFPREAVFISAANSESWYSPEWYVSFFRKLQMSRKPFELTIIRGSDVINNNSEQFGVFSERQQYFDTVFPTAVLLDLSITDKGGEPGDIYYSMTISEYRDASPKTLAELAEEKTNEETGEVEQKLVVVMNRPPQRGAIVPDRVVEVSGEVYEEPESSEIDWATTKQQANRIDRTITRVLPPSVSGTLHSVYINGLGWVDDKNCRLSEDRGTTTSMKRIITNEYI